MLRKPPPGGFLFAAIHGAHLSGQRCALLKTAPGGFLFAAIHGAHLQRPTLCVVKNRSGRFFVVLGAEKIHNPLALRSNAI
jgi:hypothetical protein